MNGAPRSILIIMTSSRNGFRRFMPSRGWILSMKRCADLPGRISTLTLTTALIRAHAGDDIAATTSRRLSLSPHAVTTRGLPILR